MLFRISSLFLDYTADASISTSCPHLRKKLGQISGIFRPLIFAIKSATYARTNIWIKAFNYATKLGTLGTMMRDMMKFGRLVFGGGRYLYLGQFHCDFYGISTP